MDIKRSRAPGPQRHCFMLSTKHSSLLQTLHPIHQQALRTPSIPSSSASSSSSSWPTRVIPRPFMDRTLYIRAIHFHRRWNDGCGRARRRCLSIFVVRFLYLPRRPRLRPTQAHTLLPKTLLLREVRSRVPVRDPRGIAP